MSKKSVDEIWKELNARPTGRGGVAAATAAAAAGGGGVFSLSNLSSLPGVTSKSRTVPSSSSVAAVRDSVLEDVPTSSQQRRGLGSTAAAAVGTSLHYDPAQAGVTPAEVASAMSGMQRLVNCLTDPDRTTRRNAIQTLQLKLTTGDAATPKPSPALLQALLCGPLLHPLLGLLEDPVEKCRAVAVEVLCEGLRVLPDVTPMLPTLVSALVRRMGQLPVAEPSEEIRLQLAALASLIVARTPGPSLASYVSELSTHLARALEDPFHEIKRVGCNCLAALAVTLHPAALQPHSERLLAPLIADLQHPHAKVRLATVSALDALVSHDGVSAVGVDGTVAAGVRPVTHDRSPAVRSALFDALAHWLGCSNSSSTGGLPSASAASGVPIGSTGSSSSTGHANGSSLPSGATVVWPSSSGVRSASNVQAYGPSLLPLLLIGVSDPQEAVATHVLQLVEQVGEVWLSSFHSTDAVTASSSGAAVALAATASSVEGVAAQDTVSVSTDVSMASADSPGLPGSSQAPATEAEGTVPGISGTTVVHAAPPATDSSASEERLQAAVAACQLPPPWHGRPPAGCRLMTQAFLPKLLPPVIRELCEWTVGQRVSASRALHTTLVLSEDAATQQLLPLLPALCSAIGDEDPGVASHVIGCVHALGAFVAPTRWLPLLLDHLAAARLSVSQKANSLVVLSGLLHAAGRAGQKLDDELLQVLARSLAAEEVRGSDHPAVRSQLLAVTRNAVAWAGERAAAPAVALPLASVLLQLYGFERDPGGQAAVADAMRALAQACSSAPDMSSSGRMATGAAAASPHGDDALVDPMMASCSSSSSPEIEQLLAGHGPALLAAATADASTWSGSDSPNFLVMRALLLLAGPATLHDAMPGLVRVLGPLLEDPDRDANLRIALLQMFDTLLEDPARGRALGGPPHSQLVLRQLLLPPLIWRAGKIAAAVRFAAITALGTLLRRNIASPPSAALQPLIEDGTLLPLLHQCLDEDWYPDVRLSTAGVMQFLLETDCAGPGLTAEQRRAVYPELLKRLDDSSNAVRIAACGALTAFAHSMQSDYCSTNTGYLASGVMIHMDDSDPGVQQAACSVLEALATVKPDVVRAEVDKVADRFRSKHCIARVRAACEAALQRTNAQLQA